MWRHRYSEPGTEDCSKKDAFVCTGSSTSNSGPSKSRHNHTWWYFHARHIELWSFEHNQGHHPAMFQALSIFFIHPFDQACANSSLFCLPSCLPPWEDSTATLTKGGPPGKAVIKLWSAQAIHLMYLNSVNGRLMVAMLAWSGLWNIYQQIASMNWSTCSLSEEWDN